MMTANLWNWPDMIRFLAILILLTTPFYFIVKMKINFATRILFACAVFQMLGVGFSLAWLELTKEEENREYRQCIRIMTRALAGEADPSETEAAIRYYLSIPEEKQPGPMELYYDLLGLLPRRQNPNTAVLHSSPDELYKYPRPVPKPFPQQGPEVDYSKIPGYAERMKQCRERNRRYPEAILVTGKLRVEGKRDLSGVAAKTPFLKDGVFIQTLYPGKELRFVQHGYDLLGIYLPRNMKIGSKPLDFGELTLRKTNPARLTEATFSVELPEAGRPATAILSTGELPSPFLREDLTENKIKTHQTIVSKTLRSGESATFRNLSKIPYELEITAPGCVRQKKYFTGGRKNIDLGKIVLRPAPVLTFQTRSTARPAETWRTETRAADGREMLTLSEHRKRPVSLIFLPDPADPKNFLAVLQNAHGRLYDFGPVPPEEFTIREKHRMPKVVKEYINAAFLRKGHLIRIVSTDGQKTDRLIYLTP